MPYVLWKIGCVGKRVKLCCVYLVITKLEYILDYHYSVYYIIIQSTASLSSVPHHYSVYYIIIQCTTVSVTSNRVLFILSHKFKW